MQNSTMLTELLIALLVIAALLIIYYFTREYRKPRGGRNNYLEALEYLVDGNEKWAIQKFKEAIRENSENIDAYLRLGDLLRKKGLTSNALKIHKDLMLRSNLSGDTQTKIKYSLMLDYEMMGNTAQAIETAYSILENDKSFHAETATRLLNYLEKEEKWQEAYDTIKKYFKNPSTQLKKKAALYLVFDGLKLQEKEQGRDARIKYKEALKTDSNCAAAYYYLGSSYYAEGRLEDAVQEWKTLCAAIPPKAQVAFDDLERTWFDLGKFTEAEKLYKSIVDKNPQNIHAYISLAEIYEKKEDFDTALDILDRMSEEFKGEPQIVGYKIQLLLNKNQNKQAGSHALEFFQKNFTLTDIKFECQECQYISNKPLWICPQCKSIDSFIS
ncbi:MAG: hypothetical protein EH225_00625 [Calditrichaeota bacterium]|nr:tetratricopeptide repeat protein [Calditrichota bacterium]RQW08131.1 MAG: hypothetical protein EH225_00625 [Calditrichota bacterium]